MENLVVITFPEMGKTMEGLTKLKELDTADEITIYGIAFIHKKEDGAIEYLYHDGAESGRKVATGAAAGVSSNASADHGSGSAIGSGSAVVGTRSRLRVRRWYK